MSCYICATNFGWLKKELECKVCRKSICKDCLTGKGDNQQLAACSNCYKKWQSSTIASSNNKSKPSHIDDVSTYFGPSMRASSTHCNPYHGGSKLQADPDAKLRERLNQLQDRNVSNGPDDKNMVFKGAAHDANYAGGSNINTPRPKRTEAEEVLMLLEQTKDEVSIDKKYEDASPHSAQTTADKIHEMEQRLLKLQGIGPENMKENQFKDYESSEDESEAAERLIQQAIAESKLEEELNACGYGHMISAKDGEKYPQVPSHIPGKSASNFHGPPEEEEELPWCCICNADAKLRCHGCDDDLYCQRCYKEGHDKFDMDDHTTSPYRKPKSKR